MQMNNHRLILLYQLYAAAQCCCHALKLTGLGSLYNDNDSSWSEISSDTAVSKAVDNSDNSYGVDGSFPIQHADINDNVGPFNHEERKFIYANFLNGCRAHATQKQQPSDLCDQAEVDRIAANSMQPSNMKNYTQLGYEKLSLPPKLVESLKYYWKKKQQQLKKNHHAHHHPWYSWPHSLSSNFEVGSTYMNHWETHYHLISIDDEYYQNKNLRTLIWDETKPILEQWIVGNGGDDENGHIINSVELSPSSLVGAHIFTERTIIPPRVESLPFVINAIIHVANDVDTPWPIEVYGHDGKAQNVTLDVGEMLVYESASVIVGRPFPLTGRYHADIMVSFEPLGYSRQHDQRLARTNDSEAAESMLSSLYTDSWLRWAKTARGKHTSKAVVPAYINKNSDAYSRWYQSHPTAKLTVEGVINTSVHTAAANGDLSVLKAKEKEDSDALFKIDANGWTALHEAVRGGHTDVAEYLIEKGLDINHRTHGGTGGSPLWWAKHIHGDDHEMVKFLKKHGAKDIEPDDSKPKKVEEYGVDEP